MSIGKPEEWSVELKTLSSEKVVELANHLLDFLRESGESSDVISAALMLVYFNLTVGVLNSDERRQQFEKFLPTATLKLGEILSGRRVVN